MWNRSGVGLALLGLLGLVATSAAAQTNPSSLAGTQWKGIYGSGTSANTPATLSISPGNGSLTGTLSYDGYEETLAISTTATRALRMKGVSFRDLRGGRTFSLDTFTVTVSPDGRTINATGLDAHSVVANEWLKLQKVDSTPGAAPQPASASLVKSLAGSNWQGGIAESQKGSEPAQLRIVQQNGGLAAVLDYDQFEEVLALTVTASSSLQMRGVTYRDLGKQGARSFTLDTAQGQISPDGHTIDGTINGRHFDFHRTN